MTVEVPLSRGLVAVIDSEDLEAVTAAGPWHAAPGKKTWYARHNRRVGRRHHWLFMHTLIAGVPAADHINGDGLDNRRSNLRPATAAQNARNKGRRSDNTSGYKGVSWNKGDRKFRAYIRVDGQLLHLGSFGDAATAARAYDTAALNLHGEFARPNFPMELTP